MQSAPGYGACSDPSGVWVLRGFHLSLYPRIVLLPDSALPPLAPKGPSAIKWPYAWKACSSCERFGLMTYIANMGKLTASFNRTCSCQGCTPLSPGMQNPKQFRPCCRVCLTTACTASDWAASSIREGCNQGNTSSFELMEAACRCWFGSWLPAVRLTGGGTGGSGKLPLSCMCMCCELLHLTGLDQAVDRHDSWASRGCTLCHQATCSLLNWCWGCPGRLRRKLPQVAQDQLTQRLPRLPLVAAALRDFRSRHAWAMVLAVLAYNGPLTAPLSALLTPPCMED